MIKTLLTVLGLCALSLLVSACGCTCESRASLCVRFLEEGNTPADVDKVEYQVNGGHTIVAYDKSKCSSFQGRLICEDFDSYTDQGGKVSTVCMGQETPGIFSVTAMAQGRTVKKLFHVNFDANTYVVFVPCHISSASGDMIFPKKTK